MWPPVSGGEHVPRRTGADGAGASDIGPSGNADADKVLDGERVVGDRGVACGVQVPVVPEELDRVEIPGGDFFFGEDVIVAVTMASLMMNFEAVEDDHAIESRQNVVTRASRPPRRGHQVGNVDGRAPCCMVVVFDGEQEAKHGVRRRGSGK